MSHISATALTEALAELRAKAVNTLVSAKSHDESQLFRGEIHAYDEIVYTLIEKPRQEAERQTLNGVDHE